MNYKSLPYAWWDKKWRERNPWPTSLGEDTRNYVLTPEEIKEYRDVLVAARESINHLIEGTRITVQALETGKHSPLYRQPPTMYTLAHVLQVLIEVAKMKLWYAYQNPINHERTCNHERQPARSSRVVSRACVPASTCTSRASRASARPACSSRPWPTR
jgi:hypothetical protein